MGKKIIQKEKPYLSPVQQNVYNVPFEQIQLISIHGQSVTGRLLISNENEVPINYRILAPKSNRLQVHPKYGVVHPRDFKVVLVTVKPSNDITDEDFFKRNYQLLIQVLESYHVDLPDIIEMFNNKPEIAKRLEKWNRKVARSPRFPKPDNSAALDELLSEPSIYNDVDLQREQVAKEKYMNNYGGKHHEQRAHISQQSAHLSQHSAKPHHVHHHYQYKKPVQNELPEKFQSMMKTESNDSQIRQYFAQKGSMETINIKKGSMETINFKKGSMETINIKGIRPYRQSMIIKQKNVLQKTSDVASLKSAENGGVDQSASKKPKKKAKDQHALSVKSIEKILKSKRSKSKIRSSKKKNIPPGETLSYFYDPDYIMKTESNFQSRNGSFTSRKSSIKESADHVFNVRNRRTTTPSIYLDNLKRSREFKNSKKSVVLSLRETLINFFLRLFNWNRDVPQIADDTSESWKKGGMQEKSEMAEPFRMSIKRDEASKKDMFEKKDTFEKKESAKKFEPTRVVRKSILSKFKNLQAEANDVAKDIMDGKTRPESRLYHDKDTRHYFKRRTSIVSIVDREHRQSMTSKSTAGASSDRDAQNLSLFQPISFKAKKKNKKKKKKRNPQSWVPKICKSFLKRERINILDNEAPEKELLQYQDINVIKLTDESADRKLVHPKKHHRKLSDILVDLLKVRNKLNQPYGDDVKQPIDYFHDRKSKCNRYNERLITKEYLEKSTVDFVSKIYPIRQNKSSIKHEDWVENDLKPIDGLPCLPVSIIKQHYPKSTNSSSSTSYIYNMNNEDEYVRLQKNTTTSNTTSKLNINETTTSSSFLLPKLEEEKWFNSSNIKPDMRRSLSVVTDVKNERASIRQPRLSMISNHTSDGASVGKSKRRVTKTLVDRFEGKKTMNPHKMKPMGVYSDKTSITRCTNNKNSAILLRGYNYMMQNLKKNPLATNPITLTRIYEYSPPGLDMRPNMIKCNVDSCDIFKENCDYLHKNPHIRDYRPQVYKSQGRGFTIKHDIPYADIEGLEFRLQTFNKKNSELKESGERQTLNIKSRESGEILNIKSGEFKESGEHKSQGHGITIKSDKTNTEILPTLTEISSVGKEGREKSEAAT